MKKNLRSLILTLSVFSLMTMQALCFPDFQQNDPLMAEQTVDELENMKLENSRKLKELQREIEETKNRISDVCADENSLQEVQQILDEKMKLQNENIYLVNNQIMKLNDSITDNELQIKDYENQLYKMSLSLEKNKELLKKRIRTSYVSGNDSIFAILTGSADFYDILAKYELVARISEHDSNILTNIKEEVSKIEYLNTVLAAKRTDLENDRSSSDKKKAELEKALSELAAAYNNNENDLYNLSDERCVLECSVEEKEKAIREEEDELKKIAADIEAIQEKMRAESIAESVRYSESVSVSESIAREEQKRAEDNKKQSVKENETAAVKKEPPVTEPPVSAEPEPSVPETQSVVSEVRSSGFIWPVPGYGHVSSGYGYRDIDRHKGVDITSVNYNDTIMGRPVVAAAGGIVARCINSCTHNYGKSSSCGCGGGYGNYVVILHDDGTYATLYGHLSNAVVHDGQRVSQGEVIGYAGTTGWSTGPHLHFEVHTLPFTYDFSNTLDPVNFIGSSY